MGKKLIDYEHISNHAFMSAFYRAHSVDVGEPYRYSFPMELAVEMFGKDAENFLYEVSQGLNIDYTTWFKDKKYVNVTGFYIMQYYRASVIYKRKHDKWLQENEVTKNDTGRCKQDKPKRVSRKGKEV